MLQWRGVEKHDSFPFKFNHHWIQEQDFRDLVTNYWNLLIGPPNQLNMESFYKKLKGLKFKERA